MIKINLVPADELENPYWYAFDLAIASAVLVVGYFLASMYLATLQAEVARISTDQEAWEQKARSMDGDIEQFNSLNRDVRALNTALSSLKEITDVNAYRHMPVIALEHLQNLKPADVWFVELVLEAGMGNSGNKVTLKGNAFDNLIVAEFLMNLQATKDQKADHSDVRSYVYFNEAKLVETKFTPDRKNDYPDLQNFLDFTFKLEYKQREPSSDKSPVAGDRTWNSTQNLAGLFKDSDVVAF